MSAPSKVEIHSDSTVQATIRVAENEINVRIVHRIYPPDEPDLLLYLSVRWHSERPDLVSKLASWVSNRAKQNGLWRLNTIDVDESRCNEYHATLHGFPKTRTVTAVRYFAPAVIQRIAALFDKSIVHLSHDWFRFREMVWYKDCYVAPHIPLVEEIREAIEAIPDQAPRRGRPRRL